MIRPVVLGARALLWVLRDNTPARRFDEANGSVCDAAERVSQWGPVESRYEYRATV